MMMQRVAMSTRGAARDWFRSSVATLATKTSVARPGGMIMEDIDTPALLVDLEAFDRNCSRLKKVMQQWPAVAIRPHVKAHKCAELAHRQLDLLGASGVCAQKVAEAEAMVEGGIMDVLVSNEIVAQSKIERLVALAAAGAQISVCVDDEDALKCLAAEAARRGTSVGVLVEVNVGHDRCGVDTPAQAVALARVAVASPSLRFLGIQAYHGGQQHVREPADRAAVVSKSCAKAAASLEALKAAGIPCPIVTGGGTGTSHLEAASGLYTEVQPGSYCFGDVDYSKNRADPSNAEDPSGQWEQSLWVLTQVMSKSESRSIVVVDAGSKAVSFDSGPPVLPSRFTDGVEVDCQNGGDEHVKLLWPRGMYQMPTQLPPVGSLLLLQPGHCDPTVNMYDEIVAYKGSRVEHVWRIGGRGPGR